MTIFELPYSIQILLIFVSQLLLVAFKVWHIQLINNHNEPLIKNIFAGTILQLVWLTSSAMGIKSIIDGDYLASGFYILGGTIGTILPILKQNRRLF